MPSPTTGARKDTMAAMSAKVTGCSEIPPPVAADGDPGQEIGQDDEAEGHVHPLDGVMRARQERGQRR